MIAIQITDANRKVVMGFAAKISLSVWLFVLLKGCTQVRSLSLAMDLNRQTARKPRFLVCRISDNASQLRLSDELPSLLSAKVFI